ncbi:MAG: hypothetical protein IPO69_02545 [Saprospiraceae bacterium]|nr:hypothetical protein [Saprospiraceae bacterium]
MIGNFYNDALTIPLMGQGGFYPGSYYYIDRYLSVRAASLLPAIPAVKMQ